MAAKESYEADTMLISKEKMDRSEDYAANHVE